MRLLRLSLLNYDLLARRVNRLIIVKETTSTIIVISNL